MAGGLLSEGITIYFKGDTSGLGGGVNQAKGLLGGLTSALGPVGTAVAAVGAATVGVGIAATKMAADYQQAMLKVQALTGASTDQMKQFDAGLKSLATETGVAPKQLADGLYNVVSAGYKGGDAMNLLALATKDAKIGMTDAATTTKSLTALLAQFGLQAKDANRVNGEMLETVTLGSGTFEQYSSSIVKAASSAAQFHISMETMNAAYATLTSSQINAAQASTDLQQSFKVMEGNIGTVTKSLEKNGIAFDETKFNAMDYGHQVSYLNTALEEANAKHVKVTGVTLQAAQAINTIATHIDTYNTDLKTLSDRQAMAQKTQEAWAVTVGGFNVSMDRLKATAQVVMIDVGQKLLPIATAGVNKLNDAMQWLMGVATKASVDFKYFIAAIEHAGIKGVAANFEYFGKQVKDVFGTVKTFAEYIFSQLTPHMDAANTMASKVAEGLRHLGDFFYNAGEKIKDFENNLLGSGPKVQGFVDGIKNIGNTLSQQFEGPLKDAADALKNELGNELKTVGGDLKDFGSWLKGPVFNAVKDAAPGFERLGKAFLGLAPAFAAIRGAGFDVFQEALKKFGPIIGEIIPPLIKFAGVLADNVGKALQFLAPYAVQAAQAIGGFLKDTIDRVAPIIKNAIEAVKPALSEFSRFWGLIWGGISQYLKGTWEVIVGVVKIAWAILTGIIKIGLDLISGNWKQAWTDLKDMLGGIWSGIKDMIHGGIDQVSGLFDAIWSVLAGKVEAPFAGAWDYIAGFFNWISDKIRWLTGQQSTLQSGATATLTGTHHFASGVENFSGGLALVGEQGPELAMLPRGTSILDNAKTSALMHTAKSTFQYPAPGSVGGSGAPVIHVHVSSPDMYVDGYKLTDRLGPHIANKLRLEQQVRRH